MADEKVFLTDERRAVLRGRYDGSDSNLRTHKSRIRKKARIALDELMEVAGSPAIDNEDVFDTEEVYTLISILLGGMGGITHVTDEKAPYPEEVRDHYDEYGGVAWRPHEDYANSLYVKLDGGLRGFHAEDDDRTPRPRD